MGQFAINRSEAGVMQTYDSLTSHVTHWFIYRLD